MHGPHRDSVGPSMTESFQQQAKFGDGDVVVDPGVVVEERIVGITGLVDGHDHCPWSQRRCKM